MASLERTTKIPGQLRGVYRQVIIKTGEVLTMAFEEAGVVDQDGKAVLPATDEGISIAIKSLCNGVLLAFTRANLRIPGEVMIEEIELADKIVNALGAPRITILEESNQLKIEYRGVAPLVKSVETPLDIDQALKSKPEDKEIVHVQLGPRMIISGSDLIDTDFTRLISN